MVNDQENERMNFSSSSSSSPSFCCQRVVEKLFAKLDYRLRCVFKETKKKKIYGD